MIARLDTVTEERSLQYLVCEISEAGRNKENVRLRGATMPTKRSPASQGENLMPTMSNLRRRKIQARQRKAKNLANRTAKAAKKVRNQKAG